MMIHFVYTSSKSELSSIVGSKFGKNKAEFRRGHPGMAVAGGKAQPARHGRGHGQTWPTMVDHGRPWSTMVDHGLPQLTIIDHGLP